MLCLANDMMLPVQPQIPTPVGVEKKFDLWRNVPRYGSSVTRHHIQACNREWTRVVMVKDPLYYSVFCPMGHAVQRQALGQMQTDELNELKLRELSCLDATNDEGAKYYGDRIKIYGPLFVTVFQWPPLFPQSINGSMVDARLSGSGDDLYIILPQNCLATNVHIIHPKAREYEVHPSVSIYATLPVDDDESDTGSQATIDYRTPPWQSLFWYDYPHQLNSGIGGNPVVDSQVGPSATIQPDPNVQPAVTETVQLTQQVSMFFWNILFN